MLSSSQFNKFKNLGDFIVPLARYNLHDPVISGFLTDQLIKETEKEILNFLQLVLKEITGENDLTWSLIDAVDILAVLGKLLILKQIYFYKKTLNNIYRRRRSNW